jgi:hypothetical protein
LAHQAVALMGELEVVEGEEDVEIALDFLG